MVEVWGDRPQPGQEGAVGRNLYRVVRYPLGSLPGLGDDLDKLQDLRQRRRQWELSKLEPCTLNVMVNVCFGAQHFDNRCLENDAFLTGKNKLNKKWLNIFLQCRTPPEFSYVTDTVRLSHSVI